MFGKYANLIEIHHAILVEPGMVYIHSIPTFCNSFSTIHGCVKPDMSHYDQSFPLIFYSAPCPHFQAHMWLCCHISAAYSSIPTVSTMEFYSCFKHSENSSFFHILFLCCNILMSTNCCRKINIREDHVSLPCSPRKQFPRKTLCKNLL